MNSILAGTGTRLVVLALTALTLVGASALANAQVTRTWVSGVGDDVNPCSRTAPCKTWAGAIAKTATGGEISALDPGGFGAVSINKALTIDGGGGQVASALASGTSGITVLGTTTGTVILRNIQINGVRDGTGGAGLSGVRVLGGTQVLIDNVDIFGFGVAGISVAPSTNPVTVMVENTRLINNAVGLAVDATAAAATVRLSNSTVQLNDTGLSTAGGGSIISFNNNRLNGNGSDGTPTQTIYQR